MPSDQNFMPVPKSYKELLVKDISLSHFPPEATTATPIIVVTLNRPSKYNAFTTQMMKDFELCYPLFDIDERVKVIVLEGAGKMFCAGADLDIGFSDTEQREQSVDHRDR
jgi:enoyl-CoA hydratase/carnithine racemase